MGGVIAGATVFAAIVSADQAAQTRREARRQHDQTMAKQEQAEDEAKLYDLQAGQDIKDSETATTDYGVDDKKKKKKTANDLLVRPIAANTTQSSLGFSQDY